jgi:geranylgeranyl diphosphate synthase type I
MTIETLKSYKVKVDKELEKFFNEKIKKAKLISPSSVEMVKLLKEYNLRAGKRIRAAMVYYGYRCFSNKNTGQILKVSMCIELVQSCLLIHDDIIDNSDIRRGSLALHKVYEKISNKRYKNKNAPHFGVSMAIIAGDILAAFANEILTKINIKEKYKSDAVRELNNVICTVIYGQVLDILSELEPVTKKDLSLIHRLKTASYTVEGPLHIGALLAGANKKQLQLLSNYGIPLGKAFQIQDDILGLFGDEKKTGKPADSDLKEGKKTLLILKALEKANKQQKEIIKKALGNKNLEKKQLEDVRKIVTETGSLEYSQKLARKLINQAKSVIQKSRFKKQGKSFLIRIADYMLEREF